MALLLKKMGKKAHSIHNTFITYLFHTILYLMLITVFGIGFYMQINARFEESNTRMLQNDEFFMTLSECQDYLYKRLFQIYDQDAEPFQKLSSYIDSFQKNGFSAVYQRDVEDLSILLEKYLENVALLEASVNGEESYEKSYAYYEETEELYEIMSRYDEVLQGQIISHERQIVNFQRIIVSLYTIIFLICFVLVSIKIVLDTRKIKGGIISPLQKLTETIGTVDFLELSKNSSMAEGNQYHEEINDAIKAYNAMLEKLQKQNLEHEELTNTKILLEKQMYLKLQHQINPHFLFNTLNMISHTAYLEGDDQTVELLETTANLLRYALDYSDRDVTLGRELEALEYYVSLQEKRFGDRICFTFELDETINGMKVPSLILQPLVENAIVHGVSSWDAGGKIWIRTQRDREMGVAKISVVDNGAGMVEEVRQTVDNEMRRTDEKEEKIGLSNVYFRLGIFYNHRSDVKIVSCPGNGTEIMLLLPLDGGNGNVFDDHC